MKFRILIILHFLFLNYAILAKPFEGTHMVSAGPSPYAASIAEGISKQGGNVVDVAVAMALTLSVTSPYFGSLGGGGFALVKINDSIQAIDFRETAPLKTSPTYYQNLPDSASITGGHAVAVPGIPAGLWELHKKYGKLKWKSLFKQPLELAKGGFKVSGEWYQKTVDNKNRFNQSGLRAFFKKKSLPYLPGEILKQPSLAKALTLFRDQNANGFYKGEVAKDLVLTVKNAGGSLSLEDLSNYKIRWLQPLIHNFNDYKIYLMPPPSSGGVVIKTAFSILEKTKLGDYKYLSSQEYHLIAEVLAKSFRGRALLGDPDFFKNPIDFLLSDKYINSLVASFDLDKSTQLSPLTDQDIYGESNETTHFSVLDSQGNSVAMTITLNGNYGSGVVSNKFGIALNNEMDDFTTRPNQPNMYGLLQGKGNFVEPGKRPLSSMSPTLVTKNDKVIISLGSPGGPRIISGVFQVLYRLLINKLDMDTAIQTPRVHHQFLPNKLFIDTDKFNPDLIQILQGKGHQIEESWMGKVYGVQVNKNGFLEGAFDSRGEGAAGGW